MCVELSRTYSHVL